MAKATTILDCSSWSRISGSILLASLVVLVVASSTGCSIVNALMSGQSYNSNDATMEKWGNPKY